jgi:2-oxoglutarate dehydrogenase E2 component (dihydrolipoamide succinyltransferase)
MATEVKIPAMGESISSGILAAWHVKDGDYVEKDQVLYELETDKITSEGAAEVAGVISIQILADEEVDIGQVIATIDESAVGSPTEKTLNTPEADTVLHEAVAGTATVESPVESKVDPVGTLSPAARKAAEETGVDTVHISGSGKDGRVTKSDIIEASRNPVSSVPVLTPAPSSDSAKFVAPEKAHTTQ